jgi:hypothetical protein
METTVVDVDTARIHDLVVEACALIERLGDAGVPSDACACTLGCLSADLLALADTAGGEAGDAARGVVFAIDEVLRRRHARAA